MTRKGSNSFEEMVLRARTRHCEECGGILVYVAGGMFRCQKCGHEQLDDFGKVKTYLEEKGPTSKHQIHLDTGVDMDIIDHLVKKSRLECTEDSPAFYKCDICGMPIKSGSICSACAKSDKVIQRGYYRSDDVGDIPKRSGKMRFTGKGF
jgi:DNA-directed RNA polymerase subunit M/transcription elongation factor TFIIS